MNYIFDFDGTISDSLPAFIATYNKNMRHNKDPLTSEEIQELRGMGARQVLKRIGFKWWQVPKLALQARADLNALLPSNNTFEGLPETIRELHGRGNRLYIVTIRSNTLNGVENYLKKYDIDSYFTEIDTNAGIFGKAKHIRKLMKKYGMKRRDTVYIGDETRDIQAARLSGLRIVSVSWGFNTRELLKRRKPNFLIDDPKQLLKIEL